MYGKNDNQLNGLANIVKMVSSDIKIGFVLDRCVKPTIKRGKKVSTEVRYLIYNSVIQEVEPESTLTLA